MNTAQPSAIRRESHASNEDAHLWAHLLGVFTRSPNTSEIFGTSPSLAYRRTAETAHVHPLQKGPICWTSAPLSHSPHYRSFHVQLFLSFDWHLSSAMAYEVNPCHMILIRIGRSLTAQQKTWTKPSTPQRRYGNSRKTHAFDLF
jgi:hypothetical protein